jgi:hypothetical protein
LDPVESASKQKLPIEILLWRQLLLLPETVIFFFRERFATPVSLYFVPGFHDLSFVDQNNR